MLRKLIIKKIIIEKIKSLGSFLDLFLLNCFNKKDIAKNIANNPSKAGKLIDRPFDKSIFNLLEKNSSVGLIAIIISKPVSILLKDIKSKERAASKAIAA